MQRALSAVQRKYQLTVCRRSLRRRRFLKKKRLPGEIDPLSGSFCRVRKVLPFFRDVFHNMDRSNYKPHSEIQTILGTGTIRVPSS